MANAPLHPSSADDSSRPSADTIRYQRIRVPRDHGSSLQIPPLYAMDDVWQANLAAVKLGDQITLKSASLPDRTLAQWRSEARKEIVSLALAYSLRYHDPDNWPMLRQALKKMGRSDLIGNGKMHLVPARQPAKRHAVVNPGGRQFATQHTGPVRGNKPGGKRRRR